MGHQPFLYHLNPSGAFSIGISIGHHHTDVVLIDFVGSVRFHTTIKNPSPTQSSNHSDFLEAIQSALNALPLDNKERIAGVGLAIPEDHHELELAPTGALERYEQLQEELEIALGIEVFVQNDITSATIGEMMFGAAKQHENFFFCYLGARLHCRLVLNHQIFNGLNNKSYDVVLLKMEHFLQDKNRPTSVLWQRSEDWPDFGDVEKQWLSKCIDTLEELTASLAHFVPTSTLILSSYAPTSVCERLGEKLTNRNCDISVISGTLNPSPKAVGAACLPFSSKFMVE